MPERVWESSLTSSIAEAGIDYTVLDDYHFRRAGLKNEELTGYFVTEDEGKTINVFPGSELAQHQRTRLRKRLVDSLLPSIDRQQRLVADDHLGRRRPKHSTTRQSLLTRRELPRNDRVVDASGPPSRTRRIGSST